MIFKRKYVREVDGRPRHVEVEKEALRVEEAEARGITWRDWRECREIGEWGLTDDGWLLELDRVNEIKMKAGRDKVSYCLYFSGGKGFSPRGILNFEENYREKRYGVAHGKRKRFTRKAAYGFSLLYSTMLLNGNIDYTLLGGLLTKSKDKDDKDKAKLARWMIKQKEIQIMVHDTLKELLAAKGVTEEHTIDLMQKIEKEAVDNKELLAVAKMYSKWLKMDTGITKTQEIGAEVLEQIGDNIKKEKLVLTQKEKQ